MTILHAFAIDISIRQIKSIVPIAAPGSEAARSVAVIIFLVRCRRSHRRPSPDTNASTGALAQLYPD